MRSLPKPSHCSHVPVYVTEILWLAQRKHLLPYLSLADQDVVKLYLGKLCQYCEEVATADY